jgi:hypothetical protein
LRGFGVAAAPMRYRARMLLDLLCAMVVASRFSAPAEAARTAAIEEGIGLILKMQEGEGVSEWPYEGVYRVRGRIPEGYRVGGTAIVAESLVRMPGYASDAARQSAVRRAIEFICSRTSEPSLSVDTYSGGYDVRGWGACYAARALLAVRACGAVPEGMQARVDEALHWYVDTLQRLEIPGTGGWNYAREPGAETPSRASPFMTAPSLQVLFEARAQGVAVDDRVVTRALDALERCRTPEGNFAYSASAQTREPERSMPGATGRMVSGEMVLLLAGRSSPDRVAAAIDAFVAYWQELERRRAKTGTHVPPYGVAPYYFQFAHWYAAQAAELLDGAQREESRRKVAALMWATRSGEGTWNDRVFPRSAAFGTATAMMALEAPNLPAPARWSPRRSEGGSR